MWPFTLEFPETTDKQSDAKSIWDRQLNEYVFRVADQYITVVDKPTQDRLINLLTTIGKPDSRQPDTFQ
ncbi:hypothetical protein GCM10028808_56880 [Spirosoma migulaei]